MSPVLLPFIILDCLTEYMITRIDGMAAVRLVIFKRVISSFMIFKDLGIVGSNYNVALALYFISYVTFEVPSNVSRHYTCLFVHIIYPDLTLPPSQIMFVNSKYTCYALLNNFLDSSASTLNTGYHF